METTALATFLTNVGSVFTALVGWMGNIGSTIVATPVLFVPCVLGIAFTAVALFRSCRG